jgi:hydrogenase-4 component F
MTPAAATLLLTAPIAAPLAMAGLYAVAGWRPATAWAGLLPPAVILADGAALAATTAHEGPVAVGGNLLRADSLSVWILLVIGAVAGPAYLRAERADEPPSAGRTAAERRYGVLVHLFLATMATADLTANLGVLWVAIEATTIVTAFLVGHRRSRAGVEAAWKYVVICSVGIALAFLGTVLIYYAARNAGISEDLALDWPTLVAHADRLDPKVVRFGFGLVVLGFGAKAGLAPLHAWLPDAHSQAPAPVSALMSGVLLAVAFTAVLRYKVIADAALGTAFPRALLVGIALLTLTVAAALLLGQRDYKRMLAYSSMEHMSLIALAAAAGTTAAIAAALLHIAGHGLAKTVAFCSSGYIMQLEHHTTRIGRVRGLLTRAPALGAAFGLAVFALLGLPPFSLFASELAIARAGFAARLGWATAVALLLVLVAFAALATRTARMLFGPAPQRKGTDPAPVRHGLAVRAPLAVGLLACAALGVSTGPLTDLLSTAAAVIGRH